MSKTAATAEATRILMGLGAAPTVVCALAPAAQWFPARIFPMLAALTEVAGMTGAALGQETLGFIVENAGWRVAMTACGAFSAFLLVLIVMFVRNAGNTESETDTQWPEAAQIGRLLVSLPILSRGLAGGLVAAAGIAFGMLWGVSVFPELPSHEPVGRPVCASFYFWGCLPGFIGSAWLCGTTRRPAPACGGGYRFSGHDVAHPVRFAGPVRAVRGDVLPRVFNGFYVLSFTMVKDQAPEELSGVAMGYDQHADHGCRRCHPANR